MRPTPPTVAKDPLSAAVELSRSTLQKAAAPSTS
jgi:hypothetical protein